MENDFEKTIPRPDHSLTVSPSQQILVVEDDLALETVILRLFRSIDPNIEVRWATTLGDAYDEMNVMVREGGPPSMVLSDIFLPNMDSGTVLWDFCKRRMPLTPFVFMSSLSPEKYGKMFERGGYCPPFIAKPFSVRECSEVILQVLES